MKETFKNLTPLFIAGAFGIMAFIIGVLWTQNRYYKDGGNTGQQPGDSALNGGQFENEPQDAVLTGVEVLDTDPIRGNPDAKIVLIEYSDYECPFCQTFHGTAQQIVNEYDGQVAWVYRHFPLANIHPGADAKAQASICVFEIGGNDAFWTFTDEVISDTDISVDSLTQIAVNAGVDAGAFDACVAEGREEEVDAQFNSGVAYGVNGTPGTLVLNTETNEAVLLSGALPFAAFKEVIDEQLAL